MECQELPRHLPSYLMWYSMITHTRAFHSGILIYKYFLHFLTPLWTGIKSPLYSGAINRSAAGQPVLLQITHWNTSRVWKTPSMSLRNTISIKSRHILLMLGQTLWAKMQRQSLVAGRPEEGDQDECPQASHHPSFAKVTHQASAALHGVNLSDISSVSLPRAKLPAKGEEGINKSARSSYSNLHTSIQSWLLRGLATHYSGSSLVALLFWEF